MCVADSRANGADRRARRQGQFRNKDTLIMRKFVLAAAAILLASTAGQAEKQLSEELKDNLTSRSLKRCLNQRDTVAYKRTFKPEEINNYCSCFAVTIINLTTQEDYDHNVATGKWLREAEDAQEADKHCRKYLNLPDVSKIRQKKW